jgi:DNA helicase-2/ATP-dependent DNA helicase PcrA
MHSLALRILRQANLLTRFPSTPLVLDQWELTNIFDAEFGERLAIGKVRTQAIRRDHEAFLSTGVFSPPNYIPPKPPITENERAAFTGFLSRFDQVYSSILPGEIVRECLSNIQAGLIEPAKLTGIKQLIVDEYQDLNPIDLEFIDSIIEDEAIIMVAGDDDQSIYSFRFALPRGIQEFLNKYPTASDHGLTQCFRCTVEVLNAATVLIAAHPPHNRIAKTVASVYASSDPSINGDVLRWRFANGVQEARAIASSCGALIEAGIAPDEILILLSDRNILEGPIVAALEARGLLFDAKGVPDHLSEVWGRVLLAVVRIIINSHDYIAHRTLFGLLPGIGTGTCLAVHERVVEFGLNYRSLFYEDYPAGTFQNRVAAAIQ